MAMNRRSSLPFRPRTSHSTSTFPSLVDSQSLLPSSSSANDFPLLTPERPRTNSTPLASVFEANALPWVDPPENRSRIQRLAELPHTLKNMARRASKSVHNRPSKARRNNGESSQHAASSSTLPNINTTPVQRPQSMHHSHPSQSQYSQNWSALPPAPNSSSASIRGKAESFTSSIRHFTRRSAISCPPGKNAASQDVDLKVLVPPGTLMGSRMDSSLRPGEAARAAAAAHNENRLGLTRLIGTRDRSSPPPIDEPDFKDSDSAVFALAESPIEPMNRTDIVGDLPNELAEIVLGNLDHATLKACKLVSTRWREVASSQYTWGRAFRNRYGPVQYQDPAPITMGGLGVGVDGKLNQDWHNMYKVRNQLEHRWSKGVQGPAAVYFSGHTDSVYCCQFDEEKIITGSRDRTIRVWDINNFGCIKVIGGPAAKPVAPPEGTQPLAVHQTATISALASVNGTPEGDAIWHVPEDYHEASILCLMYDDEILVTGSSDASCIVWDIKNLKFKPIRRLQKHQTGVLDVCFDANHIISCSKDATICIWDRLTGNLIRQLNGHRGPVNAVQLRGNFLVSASGDGTAKLWDLTEGKVMKDFQSRDRGLAAVEFSDDGTHVLAGGNDMSVYKYDCKTSKMVHLYKGHTDLVRSLFLDTANNHVLSGSYDQSMRLYEYESGNQIAVFEDWTTSWILAAKCDYRRIVATSQDGRALMLDFGSGLPGIDLLKGRLTGPPGFSDPQTFEVCRRRRYEAAKPFTRAQRRLLNAAMKMDWLHSHLCCLFAIAPALNRSEIRKRLSKDWRTKGEFKVPSATWTRLMRYWGDLKKWKRRTDSRVKRMRKPVNKKLREQWGVWESCG